MTCLCGRVSLLVARRRAVLRCLVGVLLLAGACSGGGAGDAKAGGAVSTTAATTSTSQRPTTVAPTTLQQTTTTLSPPAFGLQESVAFLDQCVAERGGAGPCQCALQSFGAVGSDLGGIEEQFGADGEFGQELRSLILQCSGAAIIDVEPAVLGELREACTLGDERLIDTCTCAVRRVVEIVPAVYLPEYASANVSPTMVDLINRCL